MSMNTASDAAPRFNPVFWLMWLLPASAVLAGFATLAIALQDADRALPGAYHWEGDSLDEDFARARAAAALGIEVTLEIGDGRCRAQVRNLATDPAALNLLLTHGSNADFDRRVRLQRTPAGDFLGACAALESGKWRLAIDDDSAAWALRATADGAFATLRARAQDPRGPSP
jgi:hypothetical protein